MDKEKVGTWEIRPPRGGPPILESRILYYHGGLSTVPFTGIGNRRGGIRRIF